MELISVQDTTTGTTTDTWVALGTTCFSPASVYSVALSSDTWFGAPYVVFSDDGVGNKATLMKYDTTT